MNWTLTICVVLLLSGLQTTSATGKWNKLRKRELQGCFEPIRCFSAGRLWFKVNVTRFSHGF